jgi:hypothetical protein
MTTRKTAILLIILVTGALIQIAPAAENQTKRINIIFHGTFSLACQMGSENDYIAGENDFPITPSHSEVGLGLALMFNLSRMFALQLSGDFLLGAEVTKEDPSDGETCDYKTYNNMNLIAGGMMRFGKNTQMFLSAGGGVNVLLPYADTEKIGSLGSLVAIEAPEKKIHPMVAVGGGVIQNLAKMLFKLEILYTRIFDYDKNFILLRLGVGF